MALEGNLTDFGLSEFLYLVDRSKKTGKLTLTTSGDQAELYFRNGKLVFATRFNQMEKLGDLLIRLGKITPQQLHFALEIQRTLEPEAHLGQIMLARQMVTQQEIIKSVRYQLEEIAFALFTWNEGDFKFQPEVTPPDDSVNIPLSLENIIIEGSRRVDEWVRIKELVTDLDMAVRFADRPQDNAQGVNLTPEEWGVFARVNGELSIRQLGKQTHMSDFEVASIIYVFLSAGLVTLEWPSTSHYRKLINPAVGI